MTLFRPFFDTSFNDHRQIRLTVQEISTEKDETRSNRDFQRFFTQLGTQKQFTFEQYKLDFVFIDPSVPFDEQTLSDVQFYRRVFGSIYFAVCQHSDELRSILDRYAKLKEVNSSNLPTHLFIRYRSANQTDEDDDLSVDEKLSTDNQDELDLLPSSRPSISSMISVDSTRTPSNLRPLESVPSDDNEPIGSDRSSLNNSLNLSASFSPIESDGTTENVKDQGDAEATASIVLSAPTTPVVEPKRTRPSLFKQKTLPTGSMFDSFENDLLRTYHRLDTALKKSSSEPRRAETTFTSIDSQWADIRLMMEGEKDCTLFEPSIRNALGSAAEQRFKTTLNQIYQHIIKHLFEQYMNAQSNVATENAKHKLSKKLIEARGIKRRADCCLLLGATERAHDEYRRAAEALKSQNDPIWNAAALEGRVAACYTSVQKPKRHLSKTLSFLRQSSLTRKLSVEKLLNRTNSPIQLQEKVETALELYRNHHRSFSNSSGYQFELDLRIRWCSLLIEQSEIQKYRESIFELIQDITTLGANIEQPLNMIYLNAYVAEAFTSLGMKRKGALYYRVAAMSGLNLVEESDENHRELPFFHRLIKNARIGYGITDNQVIFPLIQNTILNESIRLSLRRNDHTTILEDVHFAIESLIDHLNDSELEGLLTFLDHVDQTINCSYCGIPRLKSLDPLPLPENFKPWKAEAKSSIFLYRPPMNFLNHQKSLHRKVDFLWVRNQPVEIALVMDNYLPEAMTIKDLELLCDIALESKSETKYTIPARTTKRIVVQCVPKETGRLKIQGLRYRLWSTLQEFRFADFPSIRQCSCSIDVVYELPTLDVQRLSINDQTIHLNTEENRYTADVYRGENVIAHLDLINSSAEYPIETLNIDVYISGFNLTEYVKVGDYSLPLLFNQHLQTDLNLTEACERRLSRFHSTVESLTVEIRINYSNSDINAGEGYYRRQTLQLRLNFLPSVICELEEIEKDDSDSSYLICSKIENCLNEEILFDHQRIEPNQSSLITSKQEKIPLKTFPSDLSQLLNVIRSVLPTHLHYRTVHSNKHLRVPIDWSNYSAKKLEDHLSDLIQSPYQCTWHFQRFSQTFHIYLCVESNSSSLDQLEFLFVPSDECRYLNSHRILFTQIQPGEYHRAERIALLSSANDIDVLAVDVKINEIFWRRITLTIEE